MSEGLFDDLPWEGTVQRVARWPIRASLDAASGQLVLKSHRFHPSHKPNLLFIDRTL